jgi:hypothetical protein
VLAALKQVNQLAVDYETLKVEVFLRADRASWVFLSNVYDYVLRINKSIQKRQIKNDLLDLIKKRDRSTLTAAAETEAVVVRFIFSDMARQTRNNYVSVLQKALALDIKQGELLGTLDQFGGIINWLAMDNTSNVDNKISTSDQRKLQRTDSINLIRRLFALMATSNNVASVSTTQVADWKPSARELSTLKPSAKVATKYQSGDFVFFVATPSTTEGEYTLIQGFSTARDFEDQLLLQIATRLGANNDQLQAVVSEYEASMPN